MTSDEPTKEEVERLRSFADGTFIHSVRFARYDLRKLIASWERRGEALVNYGAHQNRCPWTDWRERRPTEDGGSYETNWAGKWYPRGHEPDCTCGLSAAIGGEE